MCPPPRNATLVDKLRHDFKNSYYQLTAAYIAVILTLIFLSIIFGWGR